MNSQENNEQSVDDKTDQVEENSFERQQFLTNVSQSVRPSSSPQTGTATGRFSTSFRTETQNRPTGFSSTNVSKSGRFQLDSIPTASERKSSADDRQTRNLPLIANESVTSAPKTASFSIESDSPSQIYRSTGPLQIPRRGKRLDVGIRLGRDYRLLRQLGNGQCGETWLAEEEETGNFVVLKPIPQAIQNDAEAIHSVLQSYRRVSALRFSGPLSGICPVFRFDQDEILGYFMVSAFADALPLNEYYEQHYKEYSDFPTSFAVELLKPVASALDFAHAKKITHRMLKPQNILVGKHCGIVVTDFGITEAVRRELLRKNVPSDTVSSAHWQAPEVWSDQQYSSCSDQFSLGILACQLITGELPFHGEDEEELRQSILFDEPVIEESLPEQIRLTLQKVLSKKPEDRFPSCSVFVTELTKFPEFSSGIQASDSAVRQFKNIETTLAPKDAVRQAESTFPYIKKPKGYSGYSFDGFPFGLTGLIGLATAATFTVFLGAIILWGIFSSASVNQKVAAKKKPNQQQQQSTETKTETRNERSEPTQESSASGSSLTQIGSSKWSQNIEPIPTEEFSQYLRAAADGDCNAQRRLGEVYFYGKGAKPNYPKAVEYFQLAAEQNDASAIYHLGRCYELGLGGLNRDTAQAIEAYQKAAQAGSVPAADALKRMKL